MKKTITIGGATLTIEAVRDGAAWRAEARSAGERVGPAVIDTDPDRAVDRVARWLAWQRDHDEKLRALQEAEQIYHRAIAGSAFATPADGATAIERQKEALDRLEAARLALDAARRQRPD